MNDDVGSRGLTFAQAQGYQDLPRQLRPEELSSELKALMWAAIHPSIMGCVRVKNGSRSIQHLINPWNAILRDYWVTRLHRNIDEFPGWRDAIVVAKAVVTNSKFIGFYNFIQFVLDRKDTPPALKHDIGQVLDRSLAAYRSVANVLVPISSPEQAAALAQSLAVAEKSEAKGPYAHLRAASTGLTSGNWASAVRESIHAVEAAAKSIEPSANTLGPALSRLNSSIGLNPTLGAAFNKLYGYSSDEKGVRHALVFDGQAAVGEREAIFMFGACASFVGYLLSATRVDEA